jgi:HTH-type transcriptional regulator/antitoxin HigA
MQNLEVSKTANAWAPLSRTLFVPHTESEYQQLVGLLDSLIDEVGEDESHPLASFMEVVGILIEKYEDEHYRSCPLSDLRAPVQNREP